MEYLCRREFLKRTTLGLAAIGVAPYFLDNQDLKTEIEEEYKISLHSFGEIFSKEESESCRVMDCDLIPGEWDRERLLIVKETYGQLPQHFYLLKNREPKPRIILSNRFYYKRLSNGISEIELNFYYFTREYPDIAGPLFVHELVHKLTPIIMINENLLDSTWFQKIYEIFKGGKYLNPPEGLLDQLAQTKENLDPGGQNVELDIFYDNLVYSISKRFPFETIAVLGEYYFGDGKDYFYRMYGLFFDEQTVADLYRFTKEDIFKGAEYLK